MTPSKRAALLSVTDKEGLIEFAKALQDLGFILLASAGTGAALKAAGLTYFSVEQYTGQAEILGGRVKTLHPKIHAGILARRNLPEDMAELKKAEILPIDVVAVNLYPFLEKLKSENVGDVRKMIDFIDVGGPAMIRAAAKNCHGVFPVIDPNDYEQVLSALRSGAGDTPTDFNFRLGLASKVFATVANFDLEVARYLSRMHEGGSEAFAPIEGGVFRRAQGLRYGENPHQKAGYYEAWESDSQRWWKQLSGKELSYNNLLDVDAAMRLLISFPERPTTVIIKHLNPCGVASANTLLEAFQAAKQGDPRSHFGGIMAFNVPVDRAVAEELKEGFVEIVLAPAFEPEALTLLKKSKNLRILEVDAQRAAQKAEMRSVTGGYLLQSRDEAPSAVRNGEIVSKRQPTEAEFKALELAWRVCSHVKSNAIVVARDESIVSIGAGQMSRIDSAELAIHKATLHAGDMRGSVVASDAFFPFPDGLETLLKAGATAFVVPNGAKRDDEVIAAANAGDAALIFMSERHFRH
jgi:phosphoribosylaminoimidazolecarboxamide formyltransferase/IMP cyclohydrolase